MKLHALTALLLSVCIFVTAVYGAMGEARPISPVALFAFSIGTLFLLGSTLSAVGRNVLTIHKLRVQAGQQTQASLFMGAIAREALAGNIPAGTVEVESGFDRKSFDDHTDQVSIKLRAWSSNEEGRDILRRIMKSVTIADYNPAEGYHEKETFRMHMKK